MGCNCGGSRWTPAPAEQPAQTGLDAPTAQPTYYWSGPAPAAAPESDQAPQSAEPQPAVA